MKVLKTTIIEGLEKRDITINLDAIVAIERHRDLDKTYLTLSTGREVIVRENFKDLTRLLCNDKYIEVSNKNRNEDRTQYKDY